ncbi:uncharacterized protein [Narcine bancroftii]|uniref:uncharacterized protein n=1 Tax=Narcine bancroftii TaxID=1343680 RepID=UPI00383129AA
MPLGSPPSGILITCLAQCGWTDITKVGILPRERTSILETLSRQVIFIREHSTGHCRNTMRVLLAALVLVSLFLGVLALKCNSCSTPVDSKCEVTECLEDEVCKSELSTLENATFTERGCSSPIGCGISFNTGHLRQTVICCETNLCNQDTQPESENGKKCYGCTGHECAGKLKPIACVANQKACAKGIFKGIYMSRKKHFPFRGCVNSLICSEPIHNIHNIKCCHEHLCNSSIMFSCIFPLLGAALLAWLCMR